MFGFSLDMQAVGVLAVLFVLAVAQKDPECSQPRQLQVVGAGSSFPAPLYNDVGPEYAPSRLEYKRNVDFSFIRVNSGYGRERITLTNQATNEPIGFAGVEALLTESQQADNPSLITFPVLAGALVIPYNLPELDRVGHTLILSPEVLVRIFSANITKWNDPSIVELQDLSATGQGIVMPDRDIRVTVRSDGSGDTGILTQALGTVDPDFRTLTHMTEAQWNTGFTSPNFIKNRCCKSQMWPDGIVKYFAYRATGMIGIIGSIQYTIGYIALANLKEFETIKYANLRNAAGIVTSPKSTAVQAAMDDILNKRMITGEAGLTFSLNNAQTNASYPLASFSYMIVNGSTHAEVGCCNMQEVVGFALHLLKQTKLSKFEQFALVQLSESVADTVIRNALRKITCDGTNNVYDQYRRSLIIKEQMQTWLLALIIVASLCLLLLFLGFIFLLRLQRQNRANSTRWLIGSNIIIFAPTDHAQSGMGSDSASDLSDSRIASKLGSDLIMEDLEKIPSIAVGSLKGSSRRSSQSQGALPLSMVGGHTAFAGAEGEPESEQLPPMENYVSNEVTATSCRLYYTRAEHDQVPVFVSKIALHSNVRQWRNSTKATIGRLRDTFLHSNVLNLHGITLSAEGNVYAVLDFAAKGTLHHVLHNSRYALTDTIKYNMASDVAAGLEFLHRKKSVHALLSSVTCLVDATWTTKIGDWHYRPIYMEQDHRAFGDLVGYREDYDIVSMIRLLYMDTHLFANHRSNHLKYDIYSFGLLLVEIFSQRLPYLPDVRRAGQDDFRKLLRDKVIQSSLMPEPNMQAVPDKVQTLVSSCISANIENRPTIEQIVDSIKRVGKMKPSRKGIVDSMMQVMEKHMDSLEKTVEERTTEARQVSNRMRELLHEVLPPDIANKLFAGETVPPESFDCVSMYFSDIVGFTNISSRSTPIQVMQFLNDLWVAFDRTIDQFDVYKIDTIGWVALAGGQLISPGDAYMVASGIPNRNGHAHYKHTADLALALLQQCHLFKIQHMPSEQLRIRIGLHAGPVTAGVVGAKMPQYCVFGDTVQTVMKMESSSEALRIQMSSAMHHGLQTHHKDYASQQREADAVREAKLGTTYWLLANECQIRSSA